MKPRYGIIGCGGIAKFHLDGLEKIGADIVVVSDIDREKAETVARRFNARATADYRDLLSDPAVSVVSVLTPTRLHREICLAAILAGKDVICEKTLANNSLEAHEIADAVKRKGVLFFTAYMKRFFPIVKKAKELLPSLGVLFSAHARTYQPWGIDFFNLKDASQFSWILDNYGGGILKCGGSHILNLVCYFLGRPESVSSNIDFVENTRLDRRVTSMLEYPGSLQVSFEAVAHPLEVIGYERNGLDERIEINGTNGRLDLYTVTWNKPETNPALLIHHNHVTKQSIEYRWKAVNPFDIQMEYINECLIQRTQGQPDVVDGYVVDEIIEAMGQSAEKGAKVQLRWKDSPLS
jgi:predicted dehydrogenase